MLYYWSFVNMYVVCQWHTECMATKCKLHWMLKRTEAEEVEEEKRHPINFTEDLHSLLSLSAHSSCLHLHPVQHSFAAIYKQSSSCAHNTLPFICCCISFLFYLCFSIHPFVRNKNAELTHWLNLWLSSSVFQAATTTVTSGVTGNRRWPQLLAPKTTPRRSSATGQKKLIAVRVEEVSRMQMRAVMPLVVVAVLVAERSAQLSRSSKSRSWKQSSCIQTI